MTITQSVRTILHVGHQQATYEKKVQSHFIIHWHIIISMLAVL